MQVRDSLNRPGSTPLGGTSDASYQKLITPIPHLTYAVLLGKKGNSERQGAVLQDGTPIGKKKEAICHSI